MQNEAPSAMKLKKWIYYFLKFTFLDQILVLIYNLFAFYGIVFIIQYLGHNKVLVVVALCVYIISVALFAVFLHKKVYIFLKGDSEKDGK
jgi:hypothetical protein